MEITEELISQIISTAKSAGAFIRKERENFDYGNIEHKGLNDLVSYVDKTAEVMIIKDLEKIFPDAGFIVEENTRSEKKDYNWVVDPLDGTTNFIHGIPCYAVSIALEYKGEILAGVVYEVVRDECFSAAKGKGAFLNLKKIQVSDRKELAESLIATGFPVYNFARTEPFFKCLNYFILKTHGVRRIGSAATDLCYLACGRFDAFFEYNLKPWDVAAGGLIVKEAGGTINDFSGNNKWLFGKEVSATNKKIEKEFNAVIQESFKN
jgi:myo-inositol-1(or 4)-monophosphatase